MERYGMIFVSISETDSVRFGSIFGFLLGSVLAGSGLYYYVVDEYKVSNELLTEDVYVSWLGHCARRHTTAYTHRLGTPNCSSEARGLCQGS
jgi:hypothetical protein